MWNAVSGSRSRRRFSSSSSPKPPRAFGGRRACSRRERSFARSSICAAALSTLPRRSWISVVVFCALSRRRSTLVSSWPSRRSSVWPSASRRRSTAASRSWSWCAVAVRRSPSVTPIAAWLERSSRASQTTPAPTARTARRANASAMDRRTLKTGSDGSGGRASKISPDNSEEPPGLSAGSSDSEELPDPTERKVAGRERAGQVARQPKSRNVRSFLPRREVRLRPRGSRRLGNIRSIAYAGAGDGRLRPRRRARARAPRVRAAPRAGGARRGDRRALAFGEHLVAEAGTGVGKSLAYLIPALESGQRVVVATATKALQEQLLGKDVPIAAARRSAGRSTRAS